MSEYFSKNQHFGQILGNLNRVKEMLKDADSDYVNVKTYRGDTPLHEAVRKGQILPTIKERRKKAEK